MADVQVIVTRVGERWVLALCRCRHGWNAYLSREGRPLKEWTFAAWHHSRGGAEQQARVWAERR